MFIKQDRRTTMSKEINFVSPPTTAPSTSQTIREAAALTTPEAAAYLNLRPATLEQWRWNGRGPKFCKIGRSCRYRQSDLDAFLDARVFTSTTEAQAVA
jgi:excisionase family DNA binding protein